MENCNKNKMSKNHPYASRNFESMDISITSENKIFFISFKKFSFVAQRRRGRSTISSICYSV